MIPKTIHYCWFGGKKLPWLAKKCIKSWKKYFPDYEIRRWDETNFDVFANPYISEAYKRKKYAFVSDYARFKILYENGGIYFDTDVEVVSPFDDILNGGAFMGYEFDPIENVKHGDIAPGLVLAAESGLAFYKEILELYDNLHFIHDDGTENLKTVVQYTTELFIKKGLTTKKGIQHISNITIYPEEYFSPMKWETREIVKTEQTLSIHHFAGSWLPKKHIPISSRIKMALYKTTMLTLKLLGISENRYKN